MSGFDDTKDRRELRLWPRVTWSLVMALLLIGGIGGWALTAPLNGAVITQGVVVVEANLQRIQHRDGGIVAEIAVQEGQAVTQGQLLLRLEDSQTRAEIAILQSQTVDLTARRARLMAERDGLAAIQLPAGFDTQSPDAAEIAAGELRLFEGQMLNREQQKQQLQLSIGQIQDEITGLEGQIEAKAREVALVAEEFDRTKALVDRDLAEASRLYSIDRERARLNGEASELASAVARSGGKISELQLQIIGIDQTARTEAQRELSAVETRLTELDERTIAAQDRLSRTEVRSPIDGVVNELNIHTIGGVVSPAEVLVTLVPAGSDYRIEVRLPPNQIEQVRTGQPARLRFTAFNSNLTPEMAGTVTHVAPATSRDPATGEQYYQGFVALDAGEEAKLPETGLVPGMPVEVFLTTQERTFASYLVKPLIDRFNRAFRER